MYSHYFRDQQPICPSRRDGHILNASTFRNKDFESESNIPEQVIIPHLVYHFFCDSTLKLLFFELFAIKKASKYDVLDIIGHKWK